MRIILACALLLIVSSAAAQPLAELPPSANPDGGQAAAPFANFDLQAETEHAAAFSWPEQPPAAALNAVSHEITRLPSVELPADEGVTTSVVSTPMPPMEIDDAGRDCARCQDCCFGGLCNCVPCGRRVWFRADLLMWWMQGDSTPPLLTSSPAGTPTNSVGILGLPTTTVLHGGESLGNGLRMGTRLTAGWWWQNDRHLGMQAEVFGFGNPGNSAASFPSPTDGTILARPFFNTDPAVNAPDAQILHQDGNALGSIEFAQASDIYSAAPAFRKNLLCCQNGCCQNNTFRIDGVLGYRYFQVNERFRAVEVLEPQGQLFPMGTRYELSDSINMNNEFHGIEFGAIWMRQKQRWIAELTGLIAFGDVRRQVELEGSSRITVAGVSDTTYPGGFLVRPEHIGLRVDHGFAVLPQVRGDVGYLLGRNWRISAGYNFLFLSSLVRPGGYLSDGFDGSTLAQPPASPPTGPPRRSAESVLIHGLQFGLTCCF